jgi:S1-C subfamily serine protease
MKPASGSEVAALVYTSLCTVSFDIPFLITGVAGTSFSGVGLVIDAARGLVVCDRNTVPITLGDCELCFAGSVLVKAKIKFLHPIHNFAVVQYDPKTLGDTPVRSAVFSPIEIAPGDENLTYVGLSRRHTVLSQSNVSCTRKEPFFVSCDMRPPRYAARNVELFHFDRVSAGLGGVFADEDGRVQAILASFSYASGSKNKDVFRGLPVSLLEWTVDSLRADVAPVVYTLEVSLGLISLAKARAGMGLSDRWVDRLSRKNELVRQVLKVTRVLTLSKSDGKLCVGDNLLAIDDSCLCTFRDVEKAVRGKETVTATVLRDGKCVTVEDLSVTQLGSDNTCRLVQWAGMLLQDTHRAVPLSTGFIPETVRGEKGVYCSRWCYGSPAHMYGLRAAAWITAVNGKKIANLDEFLGIVKQLEKKTERTRKEGVGEGEERKSDDGTSCVGGADDGSDDDEWEFVRLTTIDLSGKKKVCTLQPDPVYWPSMDLRRGEESDEWTLSSN